MNTDTEALTYDHIVALALEHGFKLNPQVDGRMALNDYVIDFACAVYDIGHAAAIAKATGRVVADDAAPECTCAAKDMTFGRCCKVTPNANVTGLAPEGD